MNYMTCKILVADSSFDLALNMTDADAARFKIVDTLTNEEYDIISSNSHLNGSPQFFGLEERQTDERYISEVDYSMNESGAIEL